MAMSLDGFIAGPNDADGGLHDYFFSPSSDTAEVIKEGIETTGAIVMGRRTYDIGAGQNGFEHNPYHVPTFVLSHRKPERLAKGAEAFVFVADGIESALAQARAAAGARDVVIAGGANTARQFLAAGLIEELQVHLVPVLLGDGKRLFDATHARPARLERISVVDASDATHLRFRVVT